MKICIEKLISKLIRLRKKTVHIIVCTEASVSPFWKRVVTIKYKIMKSWPKSKRIRKSFMMYYDRWITGNCIIILCTLYSASKRIKVVANPINTISQSWPPPLIVFPCVMWQIDKPNRVACPRQIVTITMMLIHLRHLILRLSWQPVLRSNSIWQAEDKYYQLNFQRQIE